jgi:hypothetical protein
VIEFKTRRPCKRQFVERVSGRKTDTYLADGLTALRDGPSAFYLCKGAQAPPILNSPDFSRRSACSVACWRDFPTGGLRPKLKEVLNVLRNVRSTEAAIEQASEVSASISSRDDPSWRRRGGAGRRGDC